MPPFDVREALAGSRRRCFRSLEIIGKVAEDQRAFDEVAQLPDVARPAIAHQRSAHSFAHRHGGHTELLRKLAHEQCGELEHVAATVLQRRQADLHDVDAEVEVGAKGPRVDAGPQRGIGGEDQANVDRELPLRADGSHLAVFQDTQQLALQGQRQLADLVEE